MARAGAAKRVAAPPAARVAGGRVVAVDVARGLAVVGVVVSHVLDALVLTGRLPAGSVVGRVNDVVYLFRLPALVLLVGLFVPGGVARHGAWGYLRRRVPLVLWVWAVWFLVQSGAAALLAGRTALPRDPLAVLQPWRVTDHLWFLPFLAVATVALVAVRPWRSAPRAVASVVGALAVAVPTWGWNPPVIGLYGLSLLPFVLAGSVVGMARLGRWLTAHPGRWALAGALGGVGLALGYRAGAVSPVAIGDIRTPATVATSLVTSACGVVVLLAVSVLVARLASRVAAPLAEVGRNTLPVFLAHLLVTGGTRIALVLLGVTWTPALIVVCSTAGVAVPLALARVVRDRPRWAWLFELPRRRSRQ